MVAGAGATKRATVTMDIRCRRNERACLIDLDLTFVEGHNPISVGAATVRLPIEVSLHFCRCGFIGNRFRCVRTRCIGGS
jgi:hypothetical protein